MLPWNRLRRPPRMPRATPGERTTMPRTTPSTRTVRWPSMSDAVVTISEREAAMIAASCAGCRGGASIAAPIAQGSPGSAELAHALLDAGQLCPQLLEVAALARDDFGRRLLHEAGVAELLVDAGDLGLQLLGLLLQLGPLLLQVDDREQERLGVAD